MVLPSSGTISLNDVNVELGKSGTTTASMNSNEFRALASSTGFPGSSGSTISMNEFYGDARPYYTYNAVYTATNNDTSWTFSGADIGSANTGRVVVVMAFTSSQNTGTSHSLTIGGVSATRRAFLKSAANQSVSLFTLPVSSGTTADMVISMGGVQNANVILRSFSVYYPKGANHGFIEGQTNEGDSTLSLSMTFSNHPYYGNMKGIFIGGWLTFDNSGTIPTRTLSTNSGNTVTNHGTVRAGTENRVNTAGSYLIGSANGTNNTVTCTFDTTRVSECVGAVFY